MTPPESATLARIETSLAHLTAELVEMKADVKEIERRLLDVERTLAGRVKPASIAGGVSASVALVMFLLYILDRFYQGG